MMIYEGGETKEDETEIIWSGYLVDPYGSGDYAFLWVESEEMSEIYYWHEED